MHVSVEEVSGQLKVYAGVSLGELEQDISFSYIAVSSCAKRKACAT
jgi:triacylglycerol esterase/lipase EstA (alpha/beta hydrolase family)